MGGNVTAMMKDGTATRAEKIPVAKIGRSKFMAVMQVFFKELNKQFKKATGKVIWANESDILSGFVFNGSTSFIMDPTISDEEIVKVKQSAGDLDITVPEELKEDVWNFLDQLEGREIIPGIRYMGSNKPTLKSVGEQINAVFVVNFGDVRCNCQVDFEFLPYENDRPSEWAKFSHGSSFVDAKANIKAVHHKYLIRAMIGGASLRDDIVICTNTSTPDKIKLSNSKEHINPRMLKFSVSKGVRVAYEPMLDGDNNQVYLDGKAVYKAIPTSRSDFITSVSGVFKVAFDDPSPADINRFSSFVGVVDLMKKYLTKEQIKQTMDRYVDLLWSSTPRAQELEVDNPQLDFEVKNSGYQYIIKQLKLKDDATKMIDAYYSDYGHRKSKVAESFIKWLEDRECFLLPGEEL